MSDRAHQFVYRRGKRLRHRCNRILARHSLVGNPPVFDNDLFPWVKSLEQHSRTIQQEAASLLNHRHAVPALEEISPDHRYLARDGKWQSFFLWGYGYRIDENCRHCPETAALVDRIPGIKTAMFSIHAPGLYIRPHKGVTKGMLTCHLGLVVPTDHDRCRMRVADSICRWENGKALFFDDTYEHEVWNETDEDRVILLIQFARPLDLVGSFVSNLFLTAVRLSPFIQDGRRNMRRWTAEFDRERSATNAKN